MRKDLTDMEYDNRLNAQRVAVEKVENEDVLIIDARGDGLVGDGEGGSCYSSNGS